MADIGEECGLGAIDLSQRLGALAFRFEGTRIRKARGDMPRHELEEAAVVGIEDATRAHAGDQEASGPRLGWRGEREDKGRLDRVRPWPGGEDADSPGEIEYLAGLAGVRGSAQRPRSARGAAVDYRMMLRKDLQIIVRLGRGDASRARSLFVQQVQHGEWNIQRIAAQNLGRIPASDLGRPLFWRTGAEIA